MGWLMIALVALLAGCSQPTYYFTFPPGHTQQDFQRDLKRTDAELTAGIVEELYEVVNAYAKERSFTLVLEASSGALVYMDSAIDITDEVIKRHDKR